jgi:hypothetical protein
MFRRASGGLPYFNPSIIFSLIHHSMLDVRCSMFFFLGPCSLPQAIIQNRTVKRHPPQAQRSSSEALLKQRAPQV